MSHLWMRHVTHMSDTSGLPQFASSCEQYAVWASHGVVYTYGVATMSRLLQIIGLFCKRAVEKRLYSAKETYNFKEPSHRSHPTNEECRMHERVMLHVWMSCITRLSRTHTRSSSIFEIGWAICRASWARLLYFALVLHPPKIVLMCQQIPYITLYRTTEPMYTYTCFCILYVYIYIYM